MFTSIRSRKGYQHFNVDIWTRNIYFYDLPLLRQSRKPGRESVGDIKHLSWYVTSTRILV